MTTKYFSYTPHEHEALLQTRQLVDMRVYMCLKEKADFTTGRLEHPSVLKLTTASLAREISQPAKERAAAQIFTRLDVRHAIDRLEAIGLIDEIDRKEGYLRLRLPMVAANTAKPAPSQKQFAAQFATNKPPKTVVAQGIEKKEGGQFAAQFAAVNDGESAETIAAQGKAVDQKPPFSMCEPSVVNPPLSPQGEGDLMLSASETQNQPQPRSAASQLAEGVEKAKTETPETRYQAAIVEAGGGLIMYPNSKQSHDIYRRWGIRGVDIRDLREAVKAVIKSPTMKPTPNAVDAFLITTITHQSKARSPNYL